MIMSFGICNLSIVPLRAEPSNKAEMISQILFGELIKIIEKSNSWLRVSLDYDNYEGWIDEKQYLPISEELFNNVKNSKSNICLDIVQLLINKTNNTALPIVLGSSLTYLVKQNFKIGDNIYTYKGELTDIEQLSNISKRKIIIRSAYKYLNAPYLWGGRSPFGIDCSGFTQMVYKIACIKLLRDASAQALQGRTLNFISDAEQGDLAFFDDDEGNIIHTGILLGENKIMHASGKVHIDIIDHFGIFNVETKKYTHKLRLIKKII